MLRNVSHNAIGVTYHPAGAPTTPMVNQITCCVDAILQQHPYTSVIILGDFNALKGLNNRTLRDTPLKQTVNKPSRCEAILDSIAGFYSSPATLPNISYSYHFTVTAHPQKNLQAVNHCSHDPNGKHLLVYSLANFDWLSLELLNSINKKTAYYNCCVLTMLNNCLPVRTITHRVSNKPSVTQLFCRLIRCQQHAWTNGNQEQYNRLRNQVNRIARQLRLKYYKSRIQRLCSCDQCSWWREKKTGLQVGLLAPKCYL